MAQAKANNHKVVMLGIFAAKDNNNKTAHLLTSEYELSSYNYFMRGQTQQYLTFSARTSAGRCQKGSHISIALKEVTYTIHAYKRVDGLTGVAITDQAYSERVAQTLITKLTAGFEQKYGNSWKKVQKDEVMQYPPISDLLKEITSVSN